MLASSNKPAKKTKKRTLSHPKYHTTPSSSSHHIHPYHPHHIRSSSKKTKVLKLMGCAFIHRQKIRREEENPSTIHLLLNLDLMNKRQKNALLILHSYYIYTNRHINYRIRTASELLQTSSVVFSFLNVALHQKSAAISDVAAFMYM